MVIGLKGHLIIDSFYLLVVHKGMWVRRTRKQKKRKKKRGREEGRGHRKGEGQEVVSAVSAGEAMSVACVGSSAAAFSPTTFSFKRELCLKDCLGKFLPTGNPAQ